MLTARKLSLITSIEDTEPLPCHRISIWTRSIKRHKSADVCCCIPDVRDRKCLRKGPPQGLHYRSADSAVGDSCNSFKRHAFCIEATHRPDPCPSHITSPAVSQRILMEAYVIRRLPQRRRYLHHAAAAPASALSIMILRSDVE